MTTSSRQNNLILNQDWTRIYQTFRNADFKSYDFENLRRVIITYLRENYPEDFNDYIESSEYLALIDAIAFLGQSLAFRIDLNSRENFIDLASRRESVLRLARMLSYNPKRNVAASGLLKFNSVSTTEALRDSNGRNLAQQTVNWNDPVNANWLEQFTLILNSAMSDNTEFGKPQDVATIQGIPTEQYRFRTNLGDVPIFSFDKIVSGRTTSFEIVSTSFKDQEVIYEESPRPQTPLAFVYRNDGKGPGSPSSGFFLMFKQGRLELADFDIQTPGPNEKVSIRNSNINNDDVWLFSLDSENNQQDEWVQIPALVGNNVAFNSVEQNVRNIYSVLTRTNDRIDLQFADGVFGNKPQGSFRVFFRISNGLEYRINPSEMRGIAISVPYINRAGVQHTLRITLGLQTVSLNAAEAESTDQIRNNAPALYYTQNRMITAEDYNLAPLSASQNIVKVKAINRTSSGISRNFDISDATGKYSDITVFADDGYIYKQRDEFSLAFNFRSRVDIVRFIRNRVEPIFQRPDIYNFYLTEFNKIEFFDDNLIWTQTQADINLSSGFLFFIPDQAVAQIAEFATGDLRFFTPGALVKFVPPAGQAFKNGQLVASDPTDTDQTDRVWIKVTRVFPPSENGDSVVFNNQVPTGAILKQIVPKFAKTVNRGVEEKIVELMLKSFNFGLRYDINTQQWRIITSDNLNLSAEFSLGRAGDTESLNLDSSWLLAFVEEAGEYTVRVRNLKYKFGSVQQNRFYFDRNERSFNQRAGKVITDQAKILGINTVPLGQAAIKNDISFEITDTVKFDDGFESDDQVEVTFVDSDRDGVIDNPDSFLQIVGSDLDLNYLFFEEREDSNGNIIFQLLPGSVDRSESVPVYRSSDQQTQIKLFAREQLVDINQEKHGQLIYLFDPTENAVKRVDRNLNILVFENQYRANIGRSGLKFQYVHNAKADRRIDPSVSNIIDVYLLTRQYDNEFRRFVSGISAHEPQVPTTEQLRIDFGSKLKNIKSISDEIIYHPVKYKILFGSTADNVLQSKFKVVKNKNSVVDNNDLKSRIIRSIDDFFDVNNWDFGDRFYLSELITHITTAVAPDISNITMVPKNRDSRLSSLYEIQSRSDELFISGATVDDIEIVESISNIEVRF